jgi:hypothetical protein
MLSPEYKNKKPVIMPFRYGQKWIYKAEHICDLFLRGAINSYEKEGPKFVRRLLDRDGG